jgi:hypothetical protein
MYITDNIPYADLESRLAGRAAEEVASPAGLYSCCRGCPPHQKGAQEPAMCEIDPLDLVETIGDGLLMPNPDQTVQFAHRSFGDIVTVTPKDAPRDKEGRQ